MEPDLSKLLAQDIAQAQDQLQNVLGLIASGKFTRQVLDEGLSAAHTLKALAAVKGLAHIEQYAAQLEQFFVKALKCDSDDLKRTLLPQLESLNREYKTICNLIPQPDEKPPLPRKLVNLVESLQGIEQRHTRRVREEHLQQLRRDEISIEQLFKSYAPWLKQAAQSVQKQVEIDYDIPKPIALPLHTVPALQTALVHLLRNALFHGIEAPSARKAQGKSETGTIQFSVEVEGCSVIVSISDDGCGLPDLSNVKVGTFEFAPLCAEETQNLPECRATETSIYTVSNTQTGLGIGLHIVKKQVEKLFGAFDLNSIPGKGTSAVIRFPLSVSRDG